MKKALAALAALLVTLVAASACGSGEPDKKADEDKASVWMKKKLEFSQNILAGLTRSDFTAVHDNAEAMGYLGHLEKWVRADVPGYKQQMSYFEFANKELIREAKEKNLEGATLAYNQLTVSCVQCHKVVRGAK